jgi:hypothetical protein
MKQLRILCLLFCACPLTAFCQAKDDLRLRVQVTTGERSRDSSSYTTTFTISPSGKTIIWEKTFGGYRAHHGGPPPPPKEYELSPSDRKRLIAVIESKGLLVTDSIEAPADTAYPPSHSYFVISMENSVGRKKGAIRVSGPRNAVQVKAIKLYQASIVLIEELYRIINSQGGKLDFEELVAAESVETHFGARRAPSVDGALQV